MPRRSSTTVPTGSPSQHTEVHDRRLKAVRVIAKASKPPIAGIAQHAPDRPGFVIMVNNKLHSVTTDGTAIV